MPGVVKNIGIVGATAAIGQILLMAQSLLIARSLGTEKFGVMSANLSLALITSVIFNLGLDVWLLRPQTSTFLSGQVRIANVVSLKLIIGSLWALSLSFFAPRIKQIYMPEVLSLALLAVLIDGINNSLYVYLYSSGQFNVSSKILVITRFIRLALTAALIFFSLDGIEVFLIVRIIIELFTSSLCLFYVRPKFRSVNINYLKDVLIGSSAYAWSEVLTTAYNNIDTNLLAIVTDAPAIVGAFVVVINIANTFYAIIQTLQNVFVPYLITKLEANEKSFRSVLALPVASYSLIGLVTWLAIRSFGHVLVNTSVGPEYFLSINLLKEIDPAVFLRILVLGMTSILVALGLQHLRILPQVIVTTIKISLGIVLVPSMGISGITFTYKFSEAMMLITYSAILIYYVKKTLAYKSINDEDL